MEHNNEYQLDHTRVQADDHRTLKGLEGKGSKCASKPQGLYSKGFYKTQERPDGGATGNFWWPLRFLGQWKRFSSQQPDTSVEWDYAAQGLDILDQTFKEAKESLVSNENYKRTPGMDNRQRFIQGSIFILRAMPADLSRDEQLSLQAAAPTSMLKVCNHSNTYPRVRLTASEPRELQLLQRVVATVVFLAFLALQHLLPYIKTLISIAYRWECENKLGEQLLSNTTSGCKWVLRRCFALIRRISHLTQGRMIEPMRNATAVCVQGAIGGLQCGLLDVLDMYVASRRNHRETDSMRYNRI